MTLHTYGEESGLIIINSVQRYIKKNILIQVEEKGKSTTIDFQQKRYDCRTVKKGRLCNFYCFS